MRTFLYRYFPRFMVGVCAVSMQGTSLQYTLLTGPVLYTKQSNFYVVKADFFNLFGYVLFPKLLVVYRPK